MTWLNNDLASSGQGGHPTADSPKGVSPAI